VLQEWRETFAEATALVAEIELRFKSGDPAADQMARLGTLLATLGHFAEGNASGELRAEVAQLQARLEQAITAGGEWLGQAGTALASQQVREKLQRAYGVT
jgi:hypothetical protein